ncbi:MAG: hypothetical protein KGH63_02630, partial [Candidatus Micrarchaeota archaeon]|nr:hypothetical protein [Candidatus Micrarchaeota archaeon]
SADERAALAQSFYNFVHGKEGQEGQGMELYGYADISGVHIDEMFKRNLAFAKSNGEIPSGILGIPYDYSIFLNAEEVDGGGKLKHTGVQLSPDEAAEARRLYLSKDILKEQLQELATETLARAKEDGADMASVQKALANITDPQNGMLAKLDTDESAARDHIMAFLNSVAKDNWNRSHQDAQVASDTPADEMAGMYEIQEALNMIGRGFTLSPPLHSTIDCKYNVYLSESTPNQDPEHPNRVSATAYFHVDIDLGQSLAVLEPESLKRRVVAAILAANPSGTTVPLDKVTYTRDGSTVKFVFPITREAEFSTMEEAKSLDIEINVPASLSPGAAGVLAYRLTALLPDQEIGKRPTLHKLITPPKTYSYITLDLNYDDAMYAGDNKYNLLRPDPNASDDILGLRHLETDPTLANFLGSWMGIKWMDNVQNANKLGHLIDSATSVYDFKPELDQIFAGMSGLDKASVDKMLKTNLDQMISNHLGSTPDAMNSWSNGVVGQAFRLLATQAAYRWAAEKAAGTPAYNDLERANEMTGLQLTALIGNTVADTPAKAQLLNSFLHQALREFVNDPHTGFTIHDNPFGSKNWEVSSSMGYSPLLRLPQTTGTAQVTNEFMATFRSVFYPMMIKEKDYNMYLRINAGASIAMPQNVRFTEYDTPVNAALGTVLSAAAAISADPSSANWQAGHDAFSALQAIFQARANAGDGHASEGVSDCANGMMQADNQNMLQFSGAIHQVQKLVATWYSGAQTSDSAVDVGQYGIHGKTFSGPQPIMAKLAAFDLSVDFFGHREFGGGLGDKLYGDFKVTADLPPAFDFTVADYMMNSYSHRPMVMSPSERVDALRGMMPNFNSWLPTVTFDTRFTQEIPVIQQAPVIGGRLLASIGATGNLSAATLTKMSLRGEYFMTPFGRAAPVSVMVEQSWENPLGGTMLPSLQMQAMMALPYVMDGFYAQVNYLKNSMPYGGGSLGYVSFTAGLKWTIFKGSAEDAPKGALPQDFTQLPPRLPEQYQRQDDIRKR